MVVERLLFLKKSHNLDCDGLYLDKHHTPLPDGALPTLVRGTRAIPTGRYVPWNLKGFACWN